MKAAQSPASTTATTNDAGIRTRDAGSGHGEYERIPDPESRIPTLSAFSYKQIDDAEGQRDGPDV